MIIPYLSFQGNCEEAIALYSEALGGKLEYASRFTAETGSPALVGKIMHMEMAFSDGAISGADQEEPVDHGKAMKLMIHYQTAAEANKALEALAVGGQILQRLTPHPPPDDSGSGALVRDKFGYTWILTAPSEQS